MPSTIQEFEQRRKVLEAKDINALYANYTKKYNKGDLVGANKIAWILSIKYGIEGEHSFALGTSQE